MLFSFFLKKSPLLYLGEVVSKVFWISEAHTCSQTHTGTHKSFIQLLIVKVTRLDCHLSDLQYPSSWTVNKDKREEERIRVCMSFYHKNSISVNVCVSLCLSPWLVAKLFHFFILNNKRWGSFFLFWQSLTCLYQCYVCMQTLPLHIRRQPNLDIDLSSQRLMVMTEPLQFITAKSNRFLPTWDSFRALVHSFLSFLFLILFVYECDTAVYA